MFNHHIALLCNKSGRQINAFSQFTNALNINFTKFYIVTFHVLLYNMAFLQY